VEWVNWIKTADEFNPQYIPISPIGVMKLGMADSRSKNIFFVAVCRSLHIPARLEEITGKLQYYHNNRWHDEGGNIANQLVKNLNLASPNNLPIVIIADTFGRVVYASQGYKIGIGDELIQIIKRL
jgi:transglutaminase-like putative cysteine protease